ncbi:REP element-mobilizing transposase RayT [Streptomyces pseudovenezuelae]|uniref:REP element-mobilizing transposase RayT n=1 Tax=Streptomyces pseudovenezuelae TaxID=67350 RepID=A0ABT6LTH8_9ACTN|nr:transposase [Streptomyces pseudovenezuelae]MDH6219620.1 REP element-mobilizing transposase RayT [Streptomyces pseudovenezuelae]
MSSRRSRQEFTGRANRAIKHGRFWSCSYLAGSCGGPPRRVVKDRIGKQKRPE